MGALFLFKVGGRILYFFPFIFLTLLTIILIRNSWLSTIRIASASEEHFNETAPKIKKATYN